MIIHLAADHGGFELKEQMKEWLIEHSYEVVDHGAYKFDLDDDYPDFILPAARAVADDENSLGIIFGGSGEGEAIAANRIKGVRAALFYGPALPIMAVDAEGRESIDLLEILKLTRQHNHANILSIGVRFVGFEDAIKAFQVWMNEPVGTAPRHKKRIDMIDYLS